ncbi:kinase-like protein [Xylaria sp. CBS 124048]|nr:kinase-like protein [Xylaria sp. CBS 124048]
MTLRETSNPSDLPINDNFVNRFLTRLAIHVAASKHLRWLWKHSSGDGGAGGGGGIFFISKFCIKTGPFVTLAEAHMMRFVAANTTIPVPKIYCAFTLRGRVYIVMEKINGECVARDWVHRSEESKQRVLGHLKNMIEQLRSIPPPVEGRVSNIMGGPIYDPRFPAPLSRGPFATTDDFHRELRENVALENVSEVPSDLLELLAFHENPYPTKLTHGDLNSFNILVQGDNIVGIIDWETSGWLPSYWEYACAWNVNPYNEFWQQEVDKFLTPMPYEAKMDGIRRKYFGDF